MDILAEYEKQRPQVIQQTVRRSESSEYGFFIRLVMRLSSGRITNTRQVSLVLAAAAGVMIFLALIIFFLVSSGEGGTPLPYEKTYHPTQPVP
jgi:hypothetical protein